MKLLVESTQPVQSFLSDEHNIILYTVAEKIENKFYKINPSGEVIDSLVIVDSPFNIAFIKGYMINKVKHQYYKWVSNGNRQPFDIVIQNMNFRDGAAAQQKQLVNILQNGKDIYADYQVEGLAPKKRTSEGLQTVASMKPFAILTYFSQNKCFQFYTDLNTYKYFSSYDMGKLLLTSLFKDVDSRLNKKIIPSKNIRYCYYQKLKSEKVRFSGGGGNAPGFDKEIDHGNLYSDIIFKTDTIRLKEFFYLSEDWEQSSFEIDGKNIGTLTKNKEQPPLVIDGYGYYSNPRLQYHC